MVKAFSIERRKGLRVKRVLSIQYRLVKSRRKITDKSWFLSTTEDMSYSGLSFFSEPELRVGDCLEVNVVMSGVVEIYKGYCKVVRIESNPNAAFQLVAVKLIDHLARGRDAKRI